MICRACWAEVMDIVQIFKPMNLGGPQSRMIFPGSVVTALSKDPGDSELPKDMPVVGGRRVVAAFWAQWQQIALAASSPCLWAD